MTTFRKLIVWVAEKEGETKDEMAERLCRVIQASDIDLTANIHATDEREVAVSFQMSGPSLQNILDVVDATIK